MAHNLSHIVIQTWSGHLWGLFFRSDCSFATPVSTWINPWTQKLSDCSSFLSSNFVMTSVGWLATVPTSRLANNRAYFSTHSCICIFTCWLFIVLYLFFFSQGKCNMNAILVGSSLSPSLMFCFVLFLPHGGEGRLRFQLERKTWQHEVFSYLSSCTETGTEI